jgi:uncharacterized protein (DUF1684 family)
VNVRVVILSIAARVGLAGCIGLAACSPPQRPYDEEIAAWRADKDALMRSEQSPLLPDQRSGFPPLLYYPVDEAFRVAAALKVVRGEDIMEMSTSTGTRRRMRRIGTLGFTLQGEPMTLTAFTEAADTTLLRLFVPFADPTNQSETYRGGRYLDLDRTPTGLYDLDFNRAYHPYCVFNATYECPIPPRENRLAVPIRAGERLSSP